VGSAINIFSLENSDTEFSAEQERLGRQLMRFRAVSLDNAWQQYSLGLLSEDLWQQARVRGIDRERTVSQPWPPLLYTRETTI